MRSILYSLIAALLVGCSSHQKDEGLGLVGLLLLVLIVLMAGKPKK